METTIESIYIIAFRIYIPTINKKYWHFRQTEKKCVGNKYCEELLDSFIMVKLRVNSDNYLLLLTSV